MMRLTNTTICLIGLVVILAGVVIYLLYFKKDEHFQKSKEQTSDQTQPHKTDEIPQTSTGAMDQQPVLVLFYADWCPHCTHMRPDWDKVKRELQGRFQVKEFESKDPEVAKHKISGFPTIRMYPRGLSDIQSAVQYNGERSANGLLRFVNTGQQ